jgi:phenylalanyl-tRNA synthetase beta subunit
VVKEVQNKLGNLVTSKEQQIQYLSIMTRVDMQHDAKVVERLARSVALNHLEKVTY